MGKDYKKWTPVKISVNKNIHRPTCKEGRVYWVIIGENVGHEQDGKGTLFARPVLVIRRFSREIFWGVPLSTKLKTGPFYDYFVLHGQRSTVLLSQLRAFDTNRISGRSIGTVDNISFCKIKNRLISLLQ